MSSFFERISMETRDWRGREKEKSNTAQYPETKKHPAARWKHSREQQHHSTSMSSAR
ncbi:hypothetical protein LR48_Vigan230s000100 [Vigna angularis]|uniref:Uncharacterized protein n=1 Tax=Phaseolus angularis TaxID=3914 RepID=A0A0L9T671_PHAAN|nr:hypothetical protein LR48_Vigan230s000100 [Vigna angularis]